MKDIRIDALRRCALEEAPECARCGEKSSEDILTLRNCGGFYLCDDCYEFHERIMNEKAN